MLLLGAIACVNLFQQRDHLEIDRFIPEYVCNYLQSYVKTHLLFAASPKTYQASHRLLFFFFFVSIIHCQKYLVWPFGLPSSPDACFGDCAHLTVIVTFAFTLALIPSPWQYES